MSMYYPSFGGYQPIYQSQYQQQAQQTSIIWGTYQDALMYPVVPNGAVQIWDKDNPVVYVKKADATGKPSMQIYDLVERKEQTKTAQTTEPRYATQDELSRLSAVVDGLQKGYEDIRLKIDSVAFREELSKNE